MLVAKLPTLFFQAFDLHGACHDDKKNMYIYIFYGFWGTTRVDAARWTRLDTQGTKTVGKMRLAVVRDNALKKTEKS